MNKAAQELGRLGGKAGRGEAKRRATSFSSESAKAALKARWAKQNETMNANLTDSQKRRLEAATAKLPAGYTYQLHDEADTPHYYAKRVWGVSVVDAGGDVRATVGRKTGGELWANLDPRHDPEKLRLAINRAAAALWHKQPLWC